MPGDYYKDATKAMQTPFRRSQLFLDTPDSVLLSSAFRWYREGKDIHNIVPGTHLHRLASGGMCLSSIYQAVHCIVERIDTQGGRVPLTFVTSDPHREASLY